MVKAVNIMQTRKDLVHMLNKISLNGYITKKPYVTTASDGRTRISFTLNVQRDHNDEDTVNTNIYDYIPVIMYKSSDEAGLPKNYSNSIIQVKGRLITYPDYRGKTQWGVLADSVSVKEVTQFNPFQVPND